MTQEYLHQSVCVCTHNYVIQPFGKYGTITARFN